MIWTDVKKRHYPYPSMIALNKLHYESNSGD